MKFIHKLGYYLGGVGIGIIILMFFLGGKKASCDYGPNARTTKHLAGLQKTYSEQAKTTINSYNLDSTTLKNLILYGNVDFSESDAQGDPCKVYYIDNSYKEKPLRMHLEKCDSILTILNITF